MNSKLSRIHPGGGNDQKGADGAIEVGHVNARGLPGVGAHGLSGLYGARIRRDRTSLDGDMSNTGVKNENALHAGPLIKTGRSNGVSCKVAVSLVHVTPFLETGTDTVAGAIL